MISLYYLLSFYIFLPLSLYYIRNITRLFMPLFKCRLYLVYMGEANCLYLIVIYFHLFSIEAILVKLNQGVIVFIVP